ncbi:MAG: GNAT family N-acetyltransferase [Ignavibacteria bacterium]|nr:MAG: GNAT family N-acetyltransferase [Ignavibacteria bacterium]
MRYKIRKATLIDAPAIGELIKISARGLSAEDYTSEQIEGALRGAFGVDSDLIKDGTYFVTEAGDVLVGCGGWSYRKKLFGGDTLASEEAGKLDPRTDSAKIRAFFVHPLWARKGIAKAILLRCEEEAGAMGFKSLELMATLRAESISTSVAVKARLPSQFVGSAGYLSIAIYNLSHFTPFIASRILFPTASAAGGS